MKRRLFYLLIGFSLSIVFSSCHVKSNEEAEKHLKKIPYLEKIGSKYQLVVEDHPFLVLGGELGNSTFTSAESMRLVWPKLKAMNLNTVLAPVFWELIEPVQGEFDFELLDQLIAEARNHDLKLVLLWFGSWKNSMSSHVPGWVKTDQATFPRAKDKDGISQEILTPFSDHNLQADLKAFVELMKHIKEIDQIEQTVIMIQPENEIGMLPSSRDYHDLANEKFEQKVPVELMNYLEENKGNLVPEFYDVWGQSGFKTEGTWEEIFGVGLPTDEIFMAWYFARYADEITKAGKEIYALPMFVNAALNRPGWEPGRYPSAGPLPHLMDVWKAGGKSIDFLSPDFYNPDFKHWNDLYTRQDDPLFIPEHRFDNTVAAKALFAVGHYEALGFAPFSIEQIPEDPLTPKEEKLAEIYNVLDQLKPLLDAHRGKNRIEGVLLDKEVKEMTFVLGDYEFKAAHTYNLGWEPNSRSEEWEPSGAAIVQTGDSEFYFAGFGASLTFKSLNNPKSRVGVLKTERGHFNDGEWIVFQHLNGDQTHQGRHIRSFVEDVSIQRFSLYEYE